MKLHVCQGFHQLIECVGKGFDGAIVIKSSNRAKSLEGTPFTHQGPLNQDVIRKHLSTQGIIKKFRCNSMYKAQEDEIESKRFQ